MEWELLYMCNIIGCIIIFLIFLYHLIGNEEDAKAESEAEKTDVKKVAAEGVQ